MKKLRAMYKGYMLHPILYKTVTRTSIVAVLMLLWERYVSDGTFSMWEAPGFLCGVVLLIWAWVDYMRLDGLTIHHLLEEFKGIKPQKKFHATRSIMDYADIVNMLNGKEQEEKIYVVQAGDTPWMIAAANDLTLNELYELNPEMTSKSYQMYIGDELVVAQEMDFLQVKQVATRTWQEEIAYDTKTTNSEEYDWGVTKTITAGQNGLKEVTADITYINGVKVSTEVLNETILVEPVTEEIIKGTHLKSGMVAQYGTGNFIWPVPNYKYVSRWMSSGHTGADICAAYGTPIIACDAGVVVTSGWHYSYGNYVIINHGNGYRTLYAHMAYSPSVSVGQSVSQGQVIGYVGSTGNSYGNHCHLEMYYNGVRFSARNVFPGM